MNRKRLMSMLITAMALTLLCVPAFAAGTGDVASAVESTWNAAAAQLKTIVNNVVFPALDMILAVFFFMRIGFSQPPTRYAPLP